tara:strand:+ start:4075 stop:4230 length:156 start_codon:yes stop_codon:yes gene_type:complete
MKIHPDLFLDGYSDKIFECYDFVLYLDSCGLLVVVLFYFFFFFFSFFFFSS